MTGEPERREYSRAALDESAVDSDPLRQLTAWLEEARAAGIQEPTAMTLATATPDGRPSARVVLLKAHDQDGLVFFTDYRSRKGMELNANPAACLLFFWPELERQVQVSGSVEPVPPEMSASYFETRPRGSQLGAWASHQSAVLPGGRPELEARLREVSDRFDSGPVPLPPHWGGYRLRPVAFEFWQGRLNRLHDRIRYTRHAPGWVIERLSP